MTPSAAAATDVSIHVTTVGGSRRSQRTSGLQSEGNSDLLLDGDIECIQKHCILIISQIYFFSYYFDNGFSIQLISFII